MYEYSRGLNKKEKKQTSGHQMSHTFFTLHTSPFQIQPKIYHPTKPKRLKAEVEAIL